MPQDPPRVLQLDLFLSNAQAYRDALAHRVNTSSVFVAFGDELSPDLKATCVFSASATERLADHPQEWCIRQLSPRIWTCHVAKCAFPP
jgi:hypothetical protein